MKVAQSMLDLCNEDRPMFGDFIEPFIEDRRDGNEYAKI
jgi:hypothetical protein